MDKMARIVVVVLLLGNTDAFSPAGVPHLRRARAGTNTQAISMLSAPPLRGTSPKGAGLLESKLKVSLVALNQMPVFKNKWADPDYDPTKEEIATKVPLHIAAFKGQVDEVRLPKNRSEMSSRRTRDAPNCTLGSSQLCVRALTSQMFFPEPLTASFTPKPERLVKIKRDFGGAQINNAPV